MTIEEIKTEILKTESKIVLLSHKNPDGDTIGSALALYHLFSNLNIDTTMIVPNDFPDFLKWMPGADRFIVATKEEKLAHQSINNATLIFFIDFNNYDRINHIEHIVKKNNAPKILIDHHPNPEYFFDFSLSGVTVSSTAELIYSFISHLGYSNKINKSIAESLFTGIMTDTGCFSHNSSKPETFETVAKLLHTGIDKNKIYNNLYNNFSENRMRLLGYALYEKMIVLSQYHTAFFSLSEKELQKFNFQLGDEEGMVNYLLSIKNIIFAVIILEKKNYVKLSFRSKGFFPANYIAKRYFHGGGHLNAAGGKSYKSLSETITKLQTILKDDQALQKYF
ncbi:MAG TPA: bifunctional oligoribonuclease/PAP phosphatase NrnA [Bacteroidales bacterium]|nr:bifunctional oligoribonuclease/PAP phosphatase NrnA [Bacteroidales bacterium]